MHRRGVRKPRTRSVDECRRPRVHWRGACVQEDDDEERSFRVPTVLAGSQCRGDEPALAACPDYNLAREVSACGRSRDVHLVCYNGPNPGELRRIMHARPRADDVQGCAVTAPCGTLRCSMGRCSKGLQCNRQAGRHLNLPPRDNKLPCTVHKTQTNKEIGHHARPRRASATAPPSTQCG